ncbi:MAG: nicotinate phosphoribosyltransferase [Armatimonadota bacterium]|nr:nicotinate phosphoribosyltransferase [bacterium]MDW8319766.1 nicotinate phosphoribosyltransferase [Armatimonadota bacterium]
MSIFDNKRIPADKLNIDWEGIRRGDYSDRYFWNGMTILAHLAREGYRFNGHSPMLEAQGIAEYRHLLTGDTVVEMQWFARRKPFTVVAGIDAAIAILQRCSGHWEGGAFFHRGDQLEILAVQDGDLAPYAGNPLEVTPVLKVRGRYRDFAILETPTLGVLTRASRIATNTYHLMLAARGKPVLFFPARFDLPSTQAIDGYAYYIGVQRYNHDTGGNTPPFVSTPAQASLWGGQAGGTVAHAMIACFLGDTTELMLQFARILPPSIPRIALVDFHNDCVKTSLQVAKAFFERYRRAVESGSDEEAQRYKLFGVRPDTGGELRDRSLQHLPDEPSLYGVCPALIRALREALDRAWADWSLSGDWRERAAEYCRQIKIVATGGFNLLRIQQFEEEGVPVDIYGVGSSFFSNSSVDGTVTDYTADVVRVKVDGRWVHMAKEGRRACDNPNLKPVEQKL